ncbi:MULTISPECIES: type IVB secretion system protein IcmH/DotU [Pseudomonas]|jgi:type VI secretion system protein ImpK|uniref:Membrane protein n=1 Tax=Pseudomonas syringae TaxID=317 RepID=A0A085UZY6_PSESX|nr:MULTISPECIES: type IVB secretion system protein IcmH/DotU [Pseudomonas]EPJ84108.1 type IV / VI secretion system protein, DotU family [Pseudomonas sp. CFII64]KFE48749.1 membrane protein [Pseudomonas syringae]
MSMDIENSGNNKTVLLGMDGPGPSPSPLTDFKSESRVERLEDRMVYAARIRPPESFSVSMNVLVSAAAPLLGEVTALKREDKTEELATLNARLCESMRAFDVAAAQSGAESSQVQAARYVLCTVLDEAVAMSPWGDRSQWSKMSLLSKFQGETSGGEKFFHLLDRVLQNPSKYLPLLELMYVCLSLGFEGKYRVLPRGNVELEAIRDSLYRQILNQRGEIPRELSPHWEGLNDGRRSLVRIVPWWLVVIFTLISLAAMYSGFAWVLGEQRETVLQPYQALDPISGQTRS